MRLAKNLMKFVVASCFLAGIAHAQIYSNRITNYADLVRSLETGNDVKAIVHYDQCLLNDSNFQRQYAQFIDGASSRINLTEFNHYKFLDNDQVKDNIEAVDDFDGFAAVNNIIIPNATLRIFEDDTAKLYFNVNDLQGNQLYSLIWTCEITNGRDEKGLALFVEP